MPKSDPFNVKPPTREIQQILSAWQTDFNQIIEKVHSLETNLVENIEKSYNIEQNLSNYIASVEQICNLHNFIDESLNDIIDKQNLIVEGIDEIHNEIIMKKGLEVGDNFESVEQIYEKAKQIEITKKEIEKGISGFTGYLKQPLKISGKRFEEVFSLVSGLEVNAVSDT